MRKISSKERESRKQKRNNVILVVFLVVILFGSTFGIIVNSFGSKNSEEGSVKYNKYNFIYYNEFWTIENYNNFIFTHNPLEIENVSFYREDITKLAVDYSQAPVYIYSEDSYSEIEIYRNLFQVAERVQNACPEKVNCSKDVPTKDCSSNFIIIRISDKNEIYEEDNCVYILGEKENLIKNSDEFLFKIFEIK